jgi:hypothetical protein
VTEGDCYRLIALRKWVNSTYRATISQPKSLLHGLISSYCHLRCIAADCRGLQYEWVSINVAEPAHITACWFRTAANSLPVKKIMLQCSGTYRYSIATLRDKAGPISCDEQKLEKFAVPLIWLGWIHTFTKFRQISYPPFSHIQVQQNTSLARSTVALASIRFL